MGNTAVGFLWDLHSGCRTDNPAKKATYTTMFKAIGTILLLYAVTNVFAHATTAFESALVATFGTLEAAATQSREELTLPRH